MDVLLPSSRKKTSPSSHHGTHLLHRYGNHSVCCLQSSVLLELDGYSMSCGSTGSIFCGRKMRRSDCIWWRSIPSEALASSLGNQCCPIKSHTFTRQQPEWLLYCWRSCPDQRFADYIVDLRVSHVTTGVPCRIRPMWESPPANSTYADFAGGRFLHMQISPPGDVDIAPTVQKSPL